MTLRQTVAIVVIYSSVYSLFLVLTPMISTFLNKLLSNASGEGLTAAQQTSFSVFISNLFAVFQAIFGIMGLVLILYIFTHHWSSEPEQTYEV